MKRTRVPLVLLLGFALLGTGCTTALWEKDRFAQYHHPADAASADLKFFYSYGRKDILAEYNEVRDGGKTVKQRAYWLDRNRWLIDHAYKPRFVSSDEARGLMPIPIVPNRLASDTSGGADLYAVVSTNGWFTIYSGQEDLVSGELPGYYDGFKQMAARLALTPATVTVDATTVAVVTSPYWGPLAVAAAFRNANVHYYPPPPPKP